MLVDRNLIKKLKNKDYAKENNLPSVHIEIYRDGGAYVEVSTRTIDKKIMNKVWDNSLVQRNIRFFKKARNLELGIKRRYAYHIKKDLIWVDCYDYDVHDITLSILDIYINHLEMIKNDLDLQGGEKG